MGGELLGDRWPCRIDDPHLRFWLSFIGPGIPAIEPVLREAVYNLDNTSADRLRQDRPTGTDPAHIQHRETPPGFNYRRSPR